MLLHLLMKATHGQITTYLLFIHRLHVYDNNAINLRLFNMKTNDSCFNPVCLKSKTAFIQIKNNNCGYEYGGSRFGME